MKGLRGFISICLTVCLLLSGNSNVVTNAQINVDTNTQTLDEGEFYVYPITVESNWFDFTVLEKVEMLQINESYLSEFTDEQLVHAIADYPYLVDIYAYESMEEGLQIFSEYCSAYSELLKRDNGYEAFVKYGNELVASYKNNPREDGRTDFVSMAILDIIDTLSIEQTDMIMTTSDEPTTPIGTSVPYRVYSENHTTTYHALADNEIVSTYGVTLVRNGSCKYNCHSYAWYSTSSSNSYWISDPTIYTTDGSYTRKFIGSVSSSIYSCGLSTNDKILYASNTHSALFVDNPLNGAPLANLTAQSKWGQLGVFKHYVTNVPAGYDYSSVTIWHRQ
jgi:hypothetical protein